VLDRTPDEHLAFSGGGPNFCLGSHLGRIEGGEMISQLLARFGDLALAGEPDRGGATPPHHGS
jgi:cytochrome P450